MGKQPVTGVTKNQVVEMEVTGMTAEAAVWTVEGFAVFVPRSAVGDVLRVKILKRAKSYAVGKIESILTPSSTHPAGLPALRILRGMRFPPYCV